MKNDISAKEFPSEWYAIASEEHFWFVWRFAAFLHQLRDLEIPLHTQIRVLEVGCGNGVIQRQIEKLTSWEIDGVDLNKDALAQCAKTRGRVFWYDIHQRDPKMAETYDALILFDVLEHIQDTETFLSDSLHCLKPGGWLFVDVPALPWMHGRFDRAVGHLRRYTRASLTRSLESSQLNVQDCRYWGLSLLPLLVLRKMYMPFVRNEAAVVDQGLNAGRAGLSGVLSTIMKLEMKVCIRPVLGSSLLAAARKIDLAVNRS